MLNADLFAAYLLATTLLVLIPAPVIMLVIAFAAAVLRKQADSPIIGIVFGVAALVFLAMSLGGIVRGFIAYGKQRITGALVHALIGCFLYAAIIVGIVILVQMND